MDAYGSVLDNPACPWGVDAQVSRSNWARPMYRPPAPLAAHTHSLSSRIMQSSRRARDGYVAYRYVRGDVYVTSSITGVARSGTGCWPSTSTAASSRLSESRTLMSPPYGAGAAHTPTVERLPGRARVHLARRSSGLADDLGRLAAHLALDDLDRDVLGRVLAATRGVLSVEAAMVDRPDGRRNGPLTNLRDEQDEHVLAVRDAHASAPWATSTDAFQARILASARSPTRIAAARASASLPRPPPRQSSTSTTALYRPHAVPAAACRSMPRPRPLNNSRAAWRRSVISRASASHLRSRRSA